MFAVQLGETSQVGSGGVVVTPPPIPTGPPLPVPPGPSFSARAAPAINPDPIGGEPTLPLPAGGVQPQPVIRRSLGAKTGVNLLGEMEKWALPDAQKVTQAILTLNGVSVKELRDLCIKAPA